MWLHMQGPPHLALHCTLVEELELHSLFQKVSAHTNTCPGGTKQLHYCVLPCSLEALSDCLQKVFCCLTPAVS